MNDYLSKNVEMFQGCSVIELGSGVGMFSLLKIIIIIAYVYIFCLFVIETMHPKNVRNFQNRRKGDILVQSLIAQDYLVLGNDLLIFINSLFSSNVLLFMIETKWYY